MINQLRAVYDEQHKNHFDRLKLKMQKERTKINSASTLRKQTEKGNAFHEPVPKMRKLINHHDSLNY